MIYSAATVNLQAAITTNSRGHYLTGSWQHVLPALKSKNLEMVARRAKSIDVLGMQESDPGSMRSGFKNQGKIVSDAADAASFAFQKNRSTWLGASGNALIAKHPILSMESVRLPSWRGSGVAGRGLLVADIDFDGSAVSVAVTHLSLWPSVRRFQADFIADRLSDKPICILLGDFNASPETAEMRSVRSAFEGHTVSRSYPRWAPAKAIDGAFWRGVDVVSESVENVSGSDHAAVFVDFKIKVQSDRARG